MLLNLLNHIGCGLSISLHGVISLPDATLCDNVITISNGIEMCITPVFSWAHHGSTLVITVCKLSFIIVS